MPRWCWLPMLLSAGCVAFLLPGCLDVRERAYEHDESQRCAQCHGDPERAGDFLLKSAPPSDLAGSTDVSYPGVGAHMIHLLASETHGEVACTECHVVPSAANTPGHADDDLPAEIVFGPLAQTESSHPKYNSVARSCSDTWCHGQAHVSWRRPRAPEATCGTCHGLPPVLPHPQVEDCSLCHGAVVDDRGAFTRPELHVDGRVQVEQPLCSSCHGTADSPAPPPDFEGNTASNESGVGAHTAHLQAERSRPLACEECHPLPGDESPLSHVDGMGAEVVFSGVGMAHERAPHWDADEASCSQTWCHGPEDADSATTPVWTDSGTLECKNCHDLPPSAPHPPVQQCEMCHSDVVSAGQRITTPQLHVNGVVDVHIPQTCTGCHGNENAAPPRDIAGNTETTFPGVGAHQIHVLGTEISRAVPCDECHLPVESPQDAGHFDTQLPAEVVFSGVARAYGAVPLYEDGSCENSYCHGADFEENRVSGGSLTAPTWTRVDGSQTVCGSCHSLPPPGGHPQVDDCSSCHQNTRPNNVSFYDPALHVNGIPETYLGPPL